MYKDEFLCMYENLKICTADLLISQKVEWEPQRFCLYPPTRCAKNFKLTLPLLILASSSWCWETLSLYIYNTRNDVWLASFNKSKFNLINHYVHHHHHHHHRVYCPHFISSDVIKKKATWGNKDYFSWQLQTVYQRARKSIGDLKHLTASHPHSRAGEMSIVICSLSIFFIQSRI